MAKIRVTAVRRKPADEAALLSALVEQQIEVHRSSQPPKRKHTAQRRSRRRIET